MNNIANNKKTAQARGMVGQGDIRRRMPAEDRRKAIIKALIPLLKIKNPVDLTIKEIADAAGVSEALLYQHFKSKDEIFLAVHDSLCERIPALEKAIAEAKPSTESLVLYFYLLAWISLKKPEELKIDPLYPRLMMQSILGDRSFALMHEEQRLGGICQLISQSLLEAESAGDLQPGVTFSGDLQKARLAFVYGIHLITMVYLNKVGNQTHPHYPRSNQELLDKTMRFLLQGLGLKTNSIQRWYQVESLEGTIVQIMTSNKLNVTQNEGG